MKSRPLTVGALLFFLASHANAANPVLKRCLENALAATQRASKLFEKIPFETSFKRPESIYELRLATGQILQAAPVTLDPKLAPIELRRSIFESMVGIPVPASSQDLAELAANSGFQARITEAYGITPTSYAGMGSFRIVARTRDDPAHVYKLYTIVTTSEDEISEVLLLKHMKRELTMEDFLTTLGKQNRFEVAAIDRSPALLSKGIVKQKEVKGGIAARDLLDPSRPTYVGKEHPELVAEAKRVLKILGENEEAFYHWSVDHALPTLTVRGGGIPVEASTQGAVRYAKPGVRPSGIDFQGQINLHCLPNPARCVLIDW